MVEYIDLIRTEEGDLPVNYNALANKPIIRVESLDEANYVNLRDLESGHYILYGYFQPFAGAPNVMTFDNDFVYVGRVSAGSHLVVISALNCIVNFLEILVDESSEFGHTYSRQDIGLLDLNAKVAALEEKVAALEAG